VAEKTPFSNGVLAKRHILSNYYATSPSGVQNILHNAQVSAFAEFFGKIPRC
jgi:hypothetical protein